MPNILVLNSAVTPDSTSRPIVDAVVEQLGRDGAQVVARDLAAQPIPHLAPETVAGVRGKPQTPAEREAERLSDSLIAELAAADVLVIGAPMYNFGLPTTLRAWFDHVLRAGKTFSYSESGPRGLVTGKRAIVVSTRGGTYASAAGPWLDFQEPYLLQLLAFIGFTQVEVIRAEGLGFGDDARKSAVQVALAKVAALPKVELEPAA